MEKTKHNLYGIAMGVALAMGSVSAMAIPDNPSAPGLHSASNAERTSLYPTFESAERTGLALVESALSLISARTHIDPVFCDAKIYKVDVNTFDTVGTATIVDFAGGSTVLDALLTESSVGAQVDVEARTDAKLYASTITDYTGSHQWSRLNNIFLDHAVWTFKHPDSGRLIPYDEHSIKDYFMRIEHVIDPITGVYVPEAWEYDWGFEVITKDGDPVAKWTELSWYRQEDSEDGVVRVRKDLISPKSAKALCRIVYKASGFAPFEYSGTVRVFRP